MAIAVGELAGHVRNMVIPYSTVTNYRQARDTFEWLLNHAGFTQLDTVHVEMADAFTIVNRTWQPAFETSVFKNNTVIIPNLFFAEDELSEQIDSVFHLLPDNVARYWRQCRTIGFTQANEWNDHAAGDITFAWISTQARRRTEISGEQVALVENESLMHPSGTTWWNYLANNAPAFSPTCVFTRLSEREIIRG